MKRDNAARRKELEDEIRGLSSDRRYPAAHAALGDWWTLGDLKTADQAFLTIACDICQRVADEAKWERLCETLAERGNEIQAARALLALGRKWLETPRQVHLNDLYRHALDRLPDLRLNLEVAELGERLSE